jgi:hypothetical protein
MLHLVGSICLESFSMGEKEVRSSVSVKGSRVGSGPPMSPGSRSNPSRASADSVPKQEAPVEQDARRSRKPAAGLAKIIGPEV